MKPSHLLVLLFLVVTACDDSSFMPDINFGFEYSIIEDFESPLISNDSLLVKVAYSGCNGEHEFEINSQPNASSYEIWLKKITPTQACDGYFVEKKSFKLPADIFVSNMIVFLSPEKKRIIIQ